MALFDWNSCQLAVGGRSQQLVPGESHEFEPLAAMIVCRQRFVVPTIVGQREDQADRDLFCQLSVDPLIARVVGQCATQPFYSGNGRALEAGQAQRQCEARLQLAGVAAPLEPAIYDRLRRTTTQSVCSLFARPEIRASGELRNPPRLDGSGESD